MTGVQVARRVHPITTVPWSTLKPKICPAHLFQSPQPPLTPTGAQLFPSALHLFGETQDSAVLSERWECFLPKY